MNLSTRQMRAFLHVARLGNFTRAAEQAHITQAGLSILIREMEKQLACRLFDRTTRVVTLTPAGRRLLPVVERLLTDLDDVAAQLGAEGDAARQTLRIAATPLVSSHLLPAGVPTPFALRTLPSRCGCSMPTCAMSRRWSRPAMPIWAWAFSSRPQRGWSARRSGASTSCA